MEHIITHTDGTTDNMQTKARVSGVTKLVQSRTFMGDDKVTLEVVSAQPIPLHIGDRLDIHGIPYYLNKPPRKTKQGERAFTYTIEMDSVQYQLVTSQFLLFDSITDDMVSNPSQHTLTGLMLNSLTGTAQDILKMIVLNANRTKGDGMWQVGTCPDNTDTRNFTLDRGTCLEALQMLCEDWSLAFSITTDPGTGTSTINLATEPKILPPVKYILTFGKDGGLQRIETSPKGEDIVTRLYAYGGPQNIPNGYITQSNTNRLCLRQQDGTRQRHMSYVEDSTLMQAYGIREAVETFDDIYPMRVGTVTAIASTGDHPELRFYDTDMFDLNERDAETGETKWLIAGTTARVTFQTGQMAGYTFDITAYDHTAHLFTINAIKEEGDIVLPGPDNSTLRIATGDRYIITDIRMPEQYITDAEDELRERAAEKLGEINKDTLQYTIEVDSRWAKAHAGDWGRPAEQPFVPGDFVGIIDPDLDITVNLRITTITHDILADKFTLTVERYTRKPRVRDTGYRADIINREQARRKSNAIVAAQQTALRAVLTAATTAEQLLQLSLDEDDPTSAPA